LTEQLDAVIRPFISATREAAPRDAALVQFGVYGYLRDVST
jgi:hypothetical protein